MLFRKYEKCGHWLGLAEVVQAGLQVIVNAASPAPAPPSAAAAASPHGLGLLGRLLRDLLCSHLVPRC